MLSELIAIAQDSGLTCHSERRFFEEFTLRDGPRFFAEFTLSEANVLSMTNEGRRLGSGSEGAALDTPDFSG